jgi:hypothetical protein
VGELVADGDGMVVGVTDGEGVGVFMDDVMA